MANIVPIAPMTRNVCVTWTSTEGQGTSDEASMYGKAERDHWLALDTTAATSGTRRCQEGSSLAGRCGEYYLINTGSSI